MANQSAKAWNHSTPSSLNGRVGIWVKGPPFQVGEGLAPFLDGVEAGEVSTEDQLMHVAGTLVRIHRLQVHRMTHR